MVALYQDLPARQQGNEPEVVRRFSEVLPPGNIAAQYDSVIVLYMAETRL